MEQIINQLVEIDSAGQALVEQAEQERSAQQEHMAEYKREMYQSYLEKQQERMEKYREFVHQEHEQRMQELQTAHASQIGNLRQAYEQHADEWVAGMVKRCTGR